MIEKLEKEIAKLQKRMGIDEIIQPDEHKDTKESQGLNQAMKTFRSMINSLQDNLIKIQEKANETHGYSSTQDEMILRKQLNDN